MLVLLDLSSAFDTVNHQILINRLRDLIGLSGPVLQWSSSYQAGRSFSVSANHIMSEVTCCVACPRALFWDPSWLCCMFFLSSQFRDVSYHLFADDLQLYCSFKASAVHKLSSLINCLTQTKQWLSDNSLQLNSEKTETLIIAPDSAIPTIKQHLGDLSLSAKTKLRNLGDL